MKPNHIYLTYFPWHWVAVSKSLRVGTLNKEVYCANKKDAVEIRTRFKRIISAVWLDDKNKKHKL